MVIQCDPVKCHKVTTSVGGGESCVRVESKKT
jgi:hypothetical protein